MKEAIDKVIKTDLTKLSHEEKLELYNALHIAVLIELKAIKEFERKETNV